MAVGLALTACIGVVEPPAGTLSAPPSTSASGASATPAGNMPTEPTSSPGTGSPTGSTTPAPATPTVDPKAYQPATPTSPAKNVPVPKLPELAKENSPAGQRAFILHWMDMYNYMRESGNEEPFLALCADTSKFCKGSASSVKGVRDDGIWRVGPPVSLAKLAQVAQEGPELNAIWQATAEEQASRYFNSEGRANDVRHETGTARYAVKLAVFRTEGRWIMVEFGGDPL